MMFIVSRGMEMGIKKLIGLLLEALFWGSNGCSYETIHKKMWTALKDKKKTEQFGVGCIEITRNTLI